MHRGTSDRRGGSRRGPDGLRGKVIKVVGDKGFCFIEPQHLPAEYRLEPGKGIFMHQSANGGRLPAEGDVGEFQVEEGDRGLRVVRVLRWDMSRPSSDSTRPAPATFGTFVHPYNFVPVPVEGLEGAAGVDPFRRAASAPHDRYLPRRFSGWLQCVLEAKSWWFIPDARKRSGDQEHKVLGYFTLDEADEGGWNAADPVADTTRPALPASSLRGMVRSVFEAATLSCFSVFDHDLLDLRIGFDPGSPGASAGKTRGVADYLPVRVLATDDQGKLRIQLLDGRRQSDPGKSLAVALVPAYHPEVKNRDGLIGEETSLWSKLASMADGAPVAALVDMAPKPRRKRRKDGSTFVAYHYREAERVVAADSAASLKPWKDQVLVFGYLHRTGPNIENKHHERIFLRWADYNDSGTNLTIEERYRRFCDDNEPCLWAEPAVVAATEAGLRGYSDRHEREIERLRRSGITTPRRIGVGAPFPSDFVDPERGPRIQEGQLLYALIEGGGTVRGLYPVALPRLSHENSREDLLHHDLHPCADPGQLCPACRVFGWVRLEDGRLAPEPARVDAVAGHVRFTHGTLKGDWGKGGRQARLTTLAILGSPKPTTTAFYLRQRPDYEEARRGRWPPVLQTALHENIPLYRRGEATVRGRKFYRCRLDVNPEGHDPSTGGIRRPPGTDGQPIRDSQNQTVHLLPRGLEFEFRVHFDNLSSEELGALVFALSLKAPEGWRAPPMRHSLGHGKPLGLGACEVSVQSLQIDVFDPRSAAHRYVQIPRIEKEEGVTGEGARSLLTEHLGAFARAWEQAEQRSPGLQQGRVDLLEMLAAEPPSGPLQYPPDPGGDDARNYKWFVANRHPKDGLGILLPEPHEERGGTGLPRSPGRARHR